MSARSASDGGPAGLYVAERRHLLGVAYSLLGSMTDAEDVLQDVFERWMAADRRDVDNPAAFLTTMTTRAALDRLRSARVQREVYTGPWLPEPVLVDDDRGPAAIAELDESLTIGYLHLMEQLTPNERAAHLLHHIYDFPYREIAPMLSTSEANCRQLASRARAKLKATQPDRGEVAPGAVDVGVAERLLAAVLGGDMDEVMSLFTDDVVHVADGGPHHHAARRPVVGAERVARFLVNLSKRLDAEGNAVEVRTPVVNGCPGIVVVADGQPTLAITIETDGDLIDRIYAVRNPDKLGRLTGFPSTPSG